MDILNSLFVSVFGMTVVFLALVLLIAMINVMSFALKQSQRTPALPSTAAGSADSRKAPEGASVPAGAGQAANTAAAATPVQTGSTRAIAGPQELKLTNVDEKTAAMVMAIVCDDSGIPPEELYFKSITLLDA